ncbi:hypothetical protein QCA50_001146 [Cerrena zonata]|uniref:MAGE domain-containing protein n=1 Tax=Cerrena zonata TaxID=2478898 RepID=A0AAW0H0U9_9APHY
MARATRSQRQSSQSQSQPTQTQRRRRATREDEDEEGEEVRMDGVDEDQEDAYDEDGLPGGDGDLNRKASDLVRLALFCEQRRTPLRRDEISKKVLGTKSRAFAEVYVRAQDILRKTFGMELVELQARSEVDDDPNQDTKKAMGVKKKAASSGVKTYILRSTLHPSIIESASLPNRDLLKVEQEQSKVGRYNKDVDDDDDDEGVKSTGSIFAWYRADQVGAVGVLHVILALILVNGRAISDNDLRSLLKRLRLSPTTSIPLSNQSTHQNLTTESYLTQLIRQSYLDRRSLGDPKPGGAKKRGRAAGASQAPKRTSGGGWGGDEDDNQYEWRWGPRAFAEVGEVAIAQFVAEFMVLRGRGRMAEEDGDEVDREDAGVRKGIEKMMSGIEKAAAGKLVDVYGAKMEKKA